MQRVFVLRSPEHELSEVSVDLIRKASEVFTSAGTMSIRLSGG
jgi:hypothetical protein